MFDISKLDPKDELDAALLKVFEETKGVLTLAKNNPDYQKRLKGMFVDSLGSPLGYGLWTLIQNKLFAA